MLAYMLDTDICIYIMRDRPAKLRERFNRFVEQICISTITLGELFYGAEKSQRVLGNAQVVEEFAALQTVLPFSPKAAAHFGQIRADLERAGTPVGGYDMLIGAHARSEGLILVTNNIREFERIDGLRLENWA
jgi:tRNA(fMet)-specific endonuclease VapC